MLETILRISEKTSEVACSHSMARTFGHVFHRYQGFKAILAERAARKYAPVVDRGIEADDVQPFWMDAPCCCLKTSCVECGEEARFWEQCEADQRAYEADMIEALNAPEPEETITGHMIAVEWEHRDGGRWWVTMDEGSLAWEIWRGRQVGVYLSDIDEVAREDAA